MPKQINLRCGGVPEHFNLPWKLAEETGIFDDLNLDLNWKDYGGGTGQMCEALRNDDLDLAILLTEGALKDISIGNPAKIVSQYVDSPLLWGVHTGPESNLNQKPFPEALTFAISRYTSGSHLMGYLYAQNKGYKPEQIDFNVIHNLDGAAKSITLNPNQLFLWEKFTTQPLVEDGVFNRIDVFPTPWAPFVVVVSEKWLNANPNLIDIVVERIQGIAGAIKHGNNSVELVSNRYGLKAVQVKQWLHSVEWSDRKGISIDVLEKVKSALVGIREMDIEFNLEEALYRPSAVI